MDIVIRRFNLETELHSLLKKIKTNAYYLTQNEPIEIKDMKYSQQLILLIAVSSL